ncbi:MAG TPA: peptidase M23 [Cytophagales bacterium]|nr:peptidase M23 [Cytophagales bacterium]HAP60932.1 peptidase M23 [Cytophagales bacterium]
MPFAKWAKALTLLLLCLGTTTVWAQRSKAELEAERAASLKQINEMSAILQRTSSEKKNSLSQLYAINRQIEAQENYLNTLEEEIITLEGEITELDLFIEALENDLQALREEYAALLYTAQKANLEDNRLLFLLSASSFNDLWMRLNYMQKYGETRRDQSEQIRFVRDALARQLADAAEKKNERESLYTSQLEEQEKLTALKETQNGLVADLSQEEDQLEAQITQRKAEVEELENTIAELVRVELERRNSTVGPSPQAPEAEELTDNFQGNHRKLPWPVASGFISLKFGRQPHPVIRGTEINNDGVDIRTNSGEQVRAVFDGTVTSVAVVPPPYHYAVIISHGDYFTVYTKLKEVTVKNGQRVMARDPIGYVFTNNEGVAELQFQVRRGTELLNPVDWLTKK